MKKHFKKKRAIFLLRFEWRRNERYMSYHKKLDRFAKLGSTIESDTVSWIFGIDKIICNKALNNISRLSFT